MARKHFSSGTPWESVAGYSRALRVGDRVYVSGTTATGDDGEIHGIGDAAAQTRRCIENVRTALQALGADLAQVVRTRIYVVDIKNWEPVAKVHGEYFGEALPATTMVEVSGLITPEVLVEIEAEAVVDEC